MYRGNENILDDIRSIQILYHEEYYYTPQEMQKYDKKIETAKKEYEIASSAALEHLKSAVNKVIESL